MRRALVWFVAGVLLTLAAVEVKTVVRERRFNERLAVQVAEKLKGGRPFVIRPLRLFVAPVDRDRTDGSTVALVKITAMSDEGRERR